MMFPRRIIGVNGHTDLNGGDPTKNVLDLVNAAIARVDDLREAETRHQTEIARLLVGRVEAMMAAESNRIDAIRAVDVDAVQKASTAANAQATALAAQVVQSAEALRAQAAATAVLNESRLAVALDPITKAVAELRQMQYKQQGERAQVQESREKGGATSNWMGLVVAISIGVGTLVLGVAAVAVSVIMRS